MSERKCYPLNRDLAKTRPMAAKYAQIYGMTGLMSEDWPSDDFYKKGYKNSEQVYSRCLVEGKTWQELLEFKEEDLKGIIL